MIQATNHKLYQAIKSQIEESRQFIVQRVNSVLVYTYFQIGKAIVENEQSGSERASYAKQTLKQLSKTLNQEYGKGYSVDNLENMRLFYLEFGKRLYHKS